MVHLVHLSLQTKPTILKIFQLLGRHKLHYTVVHRKLIKMHPRVDVAYLDRQVKNLNG